MGRRRTGLLKVHEGATNAKSRVEVTRCCWTRNATDTCTCVHRDRREKVSTEHEATVSEGRGGPALHLMSRGLSEAEAMAMVVNGFIESLAIFAGVRHRA